MCLVLVTGHAIALSPPVQRGIRVVARLPRGPASAAALIAGVSCASAVVHWGLGVIAGAFLAREIGRHAPERQLVLHYPLCGAAAYTGMAVWHGGLSGSAPLKVAEAAPAAAGGTLALGDMLLSPLNLVITGSLVLLIPLLCALLAPRDAADCAPPDLAAVPPVPERQAHPIAGVVDWLQESLAPALFIGGAGLLIAAWSLATGRIGLDINSANLIYLCAGIILQGGLRHYVEAISDGARGAGAIILQFPFYFGIIGVMKAAAIIPWVSSGLVELSSERSFPLFAFLSAGLVNLAVPSGGGQWAVQGDILLGAGGELGVDPASTVIAFAHGDAWTNMLQPFWALPLLAIMGLRARDIIGYTAVVLLLMALVVPAALLLLA
jgi:short-chain fatty acids transporter